MKSANQIDLQNIKSNRRDQPLSKVGRNWLLIFNFGFAIFFGLPWLAPVFMLWGWENAAQFIYLIYKPLCHQLPQRSYFLFGQKTMYTIDEIAKVWPNSENFFELRRFIGNPEMGWKVAWSDRMISMYGGILIGSMMISMFRKRLRSLSFWWIPVVIFPMGIDGVTHAISDVFGFKDGFRYHNAWLGSLTNNIFNSNFYIGNAIGSFNWWMRLISGLIFGIGLMYILLPVIMNQTTER